MIAGIEAIAGVELHVVFAIFFFGIMMDSAR